VGFGVEAGSERVRQTIYNKRITDHDIIAASKALNAAGVKFLTFNMVGAPSETMEEMIKTIDINQRIKTDYTRCSIMQPYPRTAIYDYCIKQGYINPDAKIQSFTYFESSILKYDRMTKKKIINIMKLFSIFCKYRWMTPHINKIVSLPLGPIYSVLFYLTYGYSIMKRYNLPLWQIFRYWLHMKRTKKMVSK
jgi:radical SAM superfamily enzyme YgiQ (UPF0313 family)